MLKQPIIGWFVLAFVVLAVLIYQLIQWDRKLKAAQQNRFGNAKPSETQQFRVDISSKKIMKSSALAFALIVLIVFGTFFYGYWYYEIGEHSILSIIEIGLLCVSLYGGFLIGSMRRRFESDHFFNELLDQSSKRQWVERKLGINEARLIKQQQTLATLAQKPHHKLQATEEIFKEYTEVTAQTLNVERVSIWLFSEDNSMLACMDFYTKSNHTHQVLAQVPASEIPEYFKALTKHRVIAADDAMQHPALLELTDGYLQDNNIGAVLDGGVWLDGKAAGVLCVEHVGGTRAWTADEKIFAGAIADLARVTLETCKRRTAEKLLIAHSAQLEKMVQARTLSLRESDKRFSYVVQHAPVAILCLNGAREIIELNPEAEKISGYSRVYAIGKTYDELFSSEETRAYNQALIRKMDEYGNFQGERTLVRRADGSTVELLVSHSIGLDADGNPLAIAIAQDMSIHNALETSLIKAREAAEASDRTKSMFVAAMSHELRTPLNSIIGFLGVVLQGISGELNPIQKSQLDRAYQSSKHLLLLISDVLDISKVEAGFLYLDSEKFELKPLFTELEHAVQHLMEGKKLALSIDCSAKLAVTTDRKRLYQVLLNVLGNAVKYTEQGSIKIKVRIEGKQLRISCKDTGIGIDQAGIGQLFQPFERVESALKIKTPGTGLGLYLSRKILTELLDGSINVQSKLGQGSTFTIIIPVNTPLTAVNKLTKMIETETKTKEEEPVS
jgi:PAS domain S-box-containing protein